MHDAALPSIRARPVLVVLCGLLRYYRLALEALRKNVLEVNKHESFHFALLTSHRIVCTDRDRGGGECPCMDKLPKNVSQDVELQLVGTNSRVVYTYLSPSFIPGHEGGNAARFAIRLLDGLRAWRSDDHDPFPMYRHVLVLRPDVVLTRPLHIERACAPSEARVRIISGAERRMMHFHDRDWDFALLSCQTKSAQANAVDAILLWLSPWRNTSLFCSRDTSPFPSRPPAFNGPFGHNVTLPPAGHARHECGGVALLQSHGLSLGNLDDQEIYARLLVTRANISAGHFNKKGPQGCVVGLNYTNRASLIREVDATSSRRLAALRDGDVASNT